MASHAQVETAQSITREAVSATLENNCFRLIVVHNTLNNWLKDRFVGHIVNTIAKWKVDSVVLSRAYTNVAKLTSTRKVLSVLVKRNSHDSVSGVEGFFDAVAMMDININVQDSLFESQELNDAQNNV